MSVPLFEQANELNQKGQYQQALELYDQVLTQNPRNAALLATMATIYLRETKTLGLSIALFQAAVKYSKDKKIPTEVYSNLGLAYKYSGQSKLAFEYMRKAVQTDPTAGTLTNYGSLYVETDSPDEGKKHLERAIKMDPKMALAHWNLALCLLGTAHRDDGWGRAWDEYEYGLHEGGMRVPKKLVPLPIWDGSHGKKVIVHGEQGIGDEIMFASMLPQMMQTNEVILDCHPRLTTLFEKSFGVKCYGTRKHPELDWLEAEKPDAMIAVGSLGKFYRRTKDSFPGTPYLQADPLPRGDKFRVGISWTGGRLAGRVARRTVPLSWWSSILSVPEVEFVSLQYTDGAAEEIALLEKTQGFSIAQPAEARATDYYETARLVKSCDLVITVCTSVVHLSGALGVPTWVMVPKHPAWRYQSSGPMPWYRSVRLYRQPEATDGAWIPVVQKVGLDLSDFMASLKERKAA